MTKRSKAGFAAWIDKTHRRAYQGLRRLGIAGPAVILAAGMIGHYAGWAALYYGALYLAVASALLLYYGTGKGWAREDKHNDKD